MRRDGDGSAAASPTRQPVEGRTRRRREDGSPRKIERERGSPEKQGKGKWDSLLSLDYSIEEGKRKK